ncbi:helix-turn-helix domain-containing protein [Finegoldia sp. BIOML-A1]|uniref:helix-turn-helix transcriptional regulator n=1 Tax=Finegoldia sp. BIOML-A1 TaxID=2584649 RepID=UPI0012AEFC4C|nr:helix-turn-helix domain-containing protein [Finegoldia sp. BIOML-A1]MSB11701.1 helix-turn-helix domain-containing protein [Finegoldia sp. BIOML-A1]
MEVILKDEQIQEIRQIVTKIIKDELEIIIESNSLDNIFLNKKETCNYLKISNNTLDEWILKGLPVIRIGKIVRFKINDINNWMSEFENTA